MVSIPIEPRDRLPRRSVRSLAWAFSFVPLAWVGIVFHGFLARASPYFDFLESASTTHTAAEFSNGWWAAEGPAAWVWIAVGVLGAHFALRHLHLNFQFTVALRRRPLTLQTRYLDAWEAPDHGWSPLEPILLTITLGIFNFAFAFVAIMYLLIAQSSQVWLTLTMLGAAGIGVIVNYLTSTSILRYIHDSFGAARRKRVKTLRQAAGSIASKPESEALLLVERMRHLSTVSDFPIQGFWRHAIPFAIAMVGQLALILATGRWLLTG